MSINSRISASNDRFNIPGVSDGRKGKVGIKKLPEGKKLDFFDRITTFNYETSTGPIRLNRASARKFIASLPSDILIGQEKPKWYSKKNVYAAYLNALQDLHLPALKDKSSSEKQEQSSLSERQSRQTEQRGAAAGPSSPPLSAATNSPSASAPNPPFPNSDEQQTDSLPSQSAEPAMNPVSVSNPPNPLDEQAEDILNEEAEDTLKTRQAGPEYEVAGDEQKNQNYIDAIESYIDSPTPSRMKLSSSLTLPITSYNMKEIDPEGKLYLKALRAYIQKPDENHRMMINFFQREAISLKKADPQGLLLLKAIRVFINNPTSNNRAMAIFVATHSINLQAADPQGSIQREIDAIQDLSKRKSQLNFMQIIKPFTS